MLEDEPLEVELATTLLYQYAHHSYRQIRGVVEGMTAEQRDEIIDLGMRHRGRYDEVARAYCSGQSFRFDILMDIGGFRDMHRHRRCVQILQDYHHAARLRHAARNRSSEAWRAATTHYGAR